MDVDSDPFQPLLAVPFAPVLPDFSLSPPSRRAPQSGGVGASYRPASSRTESTTPASSKEFVPVDLVEVPEGTVNVLLLGTDRRPNWGHWRTDTIIVASINPQAKSVAMLSIPRDLWVRIPGFGVGRINTVDFIGTWKKAEGGGPGLLKRTIEANLGLPIHRYARIDLDGFIRVIDALGGVTINVGCPVHDMFLDDPVTGEPGLTPIDLDVGVHHLDGVTALRYARSRRGGTDFDRAERQQNLLRSLMEQHLNLDMVLKLPRLWQTLGDAVETDLTLSEMIQLGYVGLQIRQNRVKSRFISWNTTKNWITPGGAQVLLPNRKTLPKALAEFVQPSQEDFRLRAEHARIEVWNSTPTKGLAHVATQRLQRLGLDVVGTGAVLFKGETRVLVYGERPHTLEVLLSALDLDEKRVVRSPEPDDRVDIRVVLGTDWNPCR